jgi:hypothetical protein
MEVPPVRELLRQGGASRKNLEAILALQVGLTASRLSVGGNLAQGETLRIAADLIDKYPLQSLDDFILMLRRGVTGHYGPIYRFDVLVVMQWMASYVEEWAAEKEKAEEERRSAPAPAGEDPQGNAVPFEKLSPDLQEKIRAFTSSIGGQKIPATTDEYLRRNGQSKPPPVQAKSAGHKYSSKRQIIESHLRILYGRLFYERDSLTKKPGWMPFEDWLKEEGVDLDNLE